MKKETNNNFRDFYWFIIYTLAGIGILGLLQYLVNGAVF